MFREGAPPPIRLSAPTAPARINPKCSRAIGLAAYYPLDGAARDISLQNPNLSITGGLSVSAPIGANGPGNYVTKYAANTDYWRLTAPSTRLQGTSTNRITVAVWYYTPDATSRQFFAFLGTGGGNNTDSWWGELAHGGGGDAQFGVWKSDGSGQVYPIPSLILSANAWHRYVMTYDGANVAVYDNGVRVGALAAYTGAIQSPAGGSTLDIGAGQFTLSPPAGAMSAHLVIADRAWTPAEVWADYDPRTRWDILWQPSGRAFAVVSAPATTYSGGLTLTGIGG